MQTAGGALFIFLLVLFVLYLAALVWVYADAQTNSPHSAVLWTLVVFFGGFLGLLLYLLIGRGGTGGRAGRQTQF
ncbi:PLDc N-terminal domain-containing protein [Natrinema salaciae]|nr:PLDc N-terminal domain-containing protein [Natrinema salaciae]